jgi:hypothetical protein
MKAKQTVLMLGLLAAMTTMAVAQQSTNITTTAKATAKATAKTTVNITKTQIQPIYPVVQYKLEDNKKKASKDQGRILRYEGLSSEPWATIATRQQNSSVSFNAAEHEPKFCLLSFGHKP